jgi:hypothetical protein
MKPRIRLVTRQPERKRREVLYAALRRARECYPKSRPLRKKLARILITTSLTPKVRIGTDQLVMFPRGERR